MRLELNLRKKTNDELMKLARNMGIETGSAPTKGILVAAIIGEQMKHRLSEVINGKCQ